MGVIKKETELWSCSVPAFPGVWLRRSHQDCIEANFVDHCRGRRLLVVCLESHAFCFLLLFWVVLFGIFRRLPSNIWELFSPKKWWEDNSQLHHWIPPHCWKQHICMHVPHLLPDLGQPPERLSSFTDPSARMALPHGWKPMWRNQISMSFCPPSNSCSTGKYNFLPPHPPAYPDLGRGFRGSTTASVPYSFSPPLVHHTLFHERIRKSCCFGWIKTQTFFPKQEKVMGKRKRRLFQKEVCLVDFNGGVKLYNSEMLLLLLLFMNYSAFWCCLRYHFTGTCKAVQLFGFFPCCKRTHSFNGVFGNMFPACGFHRPKCTRDPEVCLK